MSDAMYVLRDRRGPWSQFREAYVAERLIGLALTVDHRATFDLSRELVRIEDDAL